MRKVNKTFLGVKSLATHKNIDRIKNPTSTTNINTRYCSNLSQGERHAKFQKASANITWNLTLLKMLTQRNKLYMKFIRTMNHFSKPKLQALRSPPKCKRIQCIGQVQAQTRHQKDPAPLCTYKVIFSQCLRINLTMQRYTKEYLTMNGIAC